jgi:hypothetical protein
MTYPWSPTPLRQASNTIKKSSSDIALHPFTERRVTGNLWETQQKH